MTSKKVLIVGAGPVGLSAALFLAEKVVRSRIVDKLLKPTIYSKALAVNPRSLELLESTDATDLFIKNGYKVLGVNVYRNQKKLINRSFDSINHKYPFILIQPQADSERILNDLVEKRGMSVERGIELVKLQNRNDSVNVELKSENGKVETTNFDIIFAADGAHSICRKSLGLGFNGTFYEDPFYLCDANLSTNLEPNEPHIFLLDSALIFLLRVKGNNWRFVSNHPNYLNLLPSGTRIENVTWKSDFMIHHRVIDRYNVGQVFFGGDASHVHSPAGGRGMNLGIEDTYVFAKLFGENKLNEYHNRRYKCVPELVQRINKVTDIVRGKSVEAKLFRKLAPYLMPVLSPYLFPFMSKFLLGLDHEI